MQSPKILTVSALNRHVKQLLEYEVGEVCVEGEVSNLSRPASGHFYFSLKDESAQIRCAFFRNRQTTRFGTLKDGQNVQVVGQLSLYEARGDYQLIVKDITEAGLGELYRQFEALKNKLKAMGLFDAERKKSLPKFPMTIGIITSPSAAALQDILITLARRFPIATIVVYACEVQGKNAAPKLINALNKANQEQRCDVLLLARGGGSIEDLWSFNNEQLAYTMSQSTIPIVSGIGHETDFTIADFVADFRAATPTAAAESITPNIFDLLTLFQGFQKRLSSAIHHFVLFLNQRLAHQTQKLRSPQQAIASYWQQLDYTYIALQRAMQQTFDKQANRQKNINYALKNCNPLVNLRQKKAELKFLKHALKSHFEVIYTIEHQRLRTLKNKLLAFSPQATLERGYAIVTCQNDIIRNPNQVNLQSQLNIRLAQGQLSAKVTKITE